MSRRALSFERSFDRTEYVKLLTKTVPTTITTEKEYNEALATVEGLLKKGEKSLSPAEERFLDLLATLIERYEDRHHPIEEASPREVLRHLMEEHGLTQKAVGEVIGSKSIVSEVLSGKRAISKPQAKKLGDYFHVSPALFI